uniref:Uncharacterized protein n=1 Tax=Anguilla anguilla TaxID=7936 RepID=A0A0E9RJJ5_ANGAN
MFHDRDPFHRAVFLFFVCTCANVLPVNLLRLLRGR